jgi:saccharopine dehydrogenase-like NADP-dependent oxidoreductase
MPNSPHRVLVLGVGKVGKSVAELLLACGGGAYHLTVADRDPATVDAAAAHLRRLSGHVKHPVPFDAMTLDVTDQAALAKALQSQHAVVCMLPFNMVEGIAKAADAAGVHYFDVTEDVATTDKVHQVAKTGSGKIALVPQCGLAPGYIAIAAYELAKKFDTIDDLTLRVGALSQFPTNRLKYNVTWSADGVINEYCEPCNVMLDGRMVKVPALEGLEKFSLNGVEYEAFYTSGGVGSLIDTLTNDKKPTPTAAIAYKTIRYPGHRDLMQALLHDLGFASEFSEEKLTIRQRAGEHAKPETNTVRLDRSLLVAIFDKVVSSTPQDVVVVFCSCIGHKNGRRVQENFLRLVPATEMFGRNWPAIELTTAAGVCAMVDLHRKGELPKTGFITQESVSLPTFNNTIFGLAYEAPSKLESAVLSRS